MEFLQSKRDNIPFIHFSTDFLGKFHIKKNLNEKRYFELNLQGGKRGWQGLHRITTNISISAFSKFDVVLLWYFEADIIFLMDINWIQRFRYRFVKLSNLYLLDLFGGWKPFHVLHGRFQQLIASLYIWKLVRLMSLTTHWTLHFAPLWTVDRFGKALLYLEIPSYYLWRNNRFKRSNQGIVVIV